jgi:hypothetical protein
MLSFLSLIFCYHFPLFVFDENVTNSKKCSKQDSRQVFMLAFIRNNLFLDRYFLAVRLITLKNMPRNLNEILCRFVLIFPAFSFGCVAKQIKRLVYTSIWVMALHYLFIYKQAKFFYVNFPARLHRLAGRYDNTMPESTIQYTT